MSKNEKNPSQLIGDNPSSNTLYALQAVEEFMFAQDSKNILDGEGTHVNLEFSPDFDLENHALKLEITITLKSGNENKKPPFLSMGCNFYFILTKPENVIDIESFKNKKGLKINNSFLASLTGISISTMRGMTISRSMLSPLRNVFIPIIPNSRILEMIEGSKNSG